MSNGNRALSPGFAVWTDDGESITCAPLSEDGQTAAEAIAETLQPISGDDYLAGPAGAFESGAAYPCGWIVFGDRVWRLGAWSPGVLVVEVDPSSALRTVGWRVVEHLAELGEDPIHNLLLETQRDDAEEVEDASAAVQAAFARARSALDALHETVAEPFDRSQAWEASAHLQGSAFTHSAEDWLEAEPVEHAPAPVVTTETTPREHPSEDDLAARARALFAASELPSDDEAYRDYLAEPPSDGEEGS